MLVGTKHDNKGSGPHSSGRLDAKAATVSQTGSKPAEEPHPVAASDGPAGIGANLRRVRTSQGHSLETLARLSGVSRAMLGQIETGKSVPTVTLAWKIAQALAVPVAALIEAPRAPRALLMPKAGARHIVSGGGGFSLRELTSSEIPLNAGFSELTIGPGVTGRIAAAAPGTRASLVVAAGSLEVTVDGGAAILLGAGDAILFEAGEAQLLFNPGLDATVAYLVTAPARNGQS